MNNYSEDLLQYQSIFSKIKRFSGISPQKTAIIEVAQDASERLIRWKGLEAGVNRLSHAFRAEGVHRGSRVVIGLPNSIENILTTLAVWRLGGCAILLPSSMTSNELEGLLDLIKPELIVAGWEGCKQKTVNVTEEYIKNIRLNNEDDIPDILSTPCRAIATGGSTGTPKIIVEDSVSGYREKDYISWSLITGQIWGQTQLVAGSIYHSLFNTTLYFGISMGQKIILMKKFDETLLLKLIEKYKVNSMALVPTMMSRIIHSPAIKTTNLNSIQTIHHAGSVCPVWLKHAWIDLIGPKKIHEFYSMSEKIGMTHIRGDEWLQHEGSVGRPVGCTVRILDETGERVPYGTIGNIYFKSPEPPTSHYLGSKGFDTSADGAVTVGDLGWLDKDGYLYIVDRRCDMIISGGKNIYAAEIENALREYPLIRDIVVIGLPDKTWGKRVHAIIEPSCPPEEFPIEDLAQFAHKKLSSYKCPKTFEFVDKLPRDDAGKLRRKKMVEDRCIGDEVSDKFDILQFPHINNKLNGDK